MAGKPSYAADFIAQVVAYGAKHGAPAATRAFKALDGRPMEYATVRRWMEKAGVDPRTPANVGGKTGGEPPKETEEHKRSGDTWDIRMETLKQIKTLPELIAACEIDTTVWEVKNFTSKAYQMGYKDNDGNPGTVQMFSVSANLRRKVLVIGIKEELTAALAEFRAGISRGPLVLVKAPKSGLMLEPSTPDLHAGKYVWAQEIGAGGENYDLAIALARLNTAFEQLLARSAHLSFERVVLPIGSDLFNSNGLAGTTAKGTPVDNDGRIVKVFGATLRAYVPIIERLANDVAPVDALGILGNHDELLAQMLIEALAARFHDHPHVTIDTSPTMRKYREWGRVMLGFAHGDKGKPERWAHLMATEQKAMWSRTEFREFHVGHLHTKRVYVDEVGGVRVRVLPSLTATDAWHAGEGFVGNLRSAEAYHWSATDGLIGKAVYSVSEDLERAA